MAVTGTRSGGPGPGSAEGSTSGGGLDGVPGDSKPCFPDSLARSFHATVPFLGGKERIESGLPTGKVG